MIAGLITTLATNSPIANLCFALAVLAITDLVRSIFG
jgi:hypothetical protein